MCRLFAQISPTPKSAKDFLVDSEMSLLRQSDHQRRNLQKDGWGVAYFGNHGAQVIKSPGPIFKEKKNFESVASRIRSRVVLSHIRAASNPRNLPMKRMISRVNSQPFTNGKIVFAHNGTLQIPLEVAAFLGAYRKNIKGLNDSEVYFWQFMKFYDAYGNVPEALQGCIRETWFIWESCKDKYPGKKTPYTGLNTLVSDGNSLHAMCHYPFGKEGSSSIFNPKSPWGRMSLTRRGDRIVFASENMDRRSWLRFAESEIVSATPKNGRLQLIRQRFDHTKAPTI